MLPAGKYGYDQLQSVTCAGTAPIHQSSIRTASCYLQFVATGIQISGTLERIPDCCIVFARVLLCVSMARERMADSNSVSVSDSGDLVQEFSMQLVYMKIWH